MKQIAVLGAGLIARPLVNYLLELPGVEVTVADAIVDAAAGVVEGKPNGRFAELDVSDATALDAIVGASDLVISIVPPSFHLLVAQVCIRHRKPLVTTSYTSPEIRALDSEAKEAGIPIVMEIGEDPGIDHMSTVRLLDEIKAKGGEVEAVRMYCGGLIDWSSNRNPFNYKFSWSPKGVFLAANAEGVYLRDGEIVRKQGGADLFADAPFVDVPGAGTFETYPNRDNRIYPPLYGIPEVRNFYRGLLRFPGWCQMMWALGRLGYLADGRQEEFAGRTLGDILRTRLSLRPGTDLREAVARRLEIGVNDNALLRLEWAGLFGDEPARIDKGSPMDLLVDVLKRKLPYERGERDLIVLHHEIDATVGGKRERHLSTLIRRGDPHPEGESAMSRAVGLPAAIAAQMLIEGRLDLTGVHIPVRPEIYGPVLDRLAELDLAPDESVVGLG